MTKCFTLLLVLLVASCSGSEESSITTAKNTSRCSGEVLSECLKQCEQGEGFSCYTAAQMYRLGKGGAVESKVDASKYYELSCNNNYAEGCEAVYSLYLYGVGVAQSTEKSNQALKKACELGHAKSCEKLELKQSLGVQ